MKRPSNIPAGAVKLPGGNYWRFNGPTGPRYFDETGKKINGNANQAKILNLELDIKFSMKRVRSVIRKVRSEMNSWPGIDKNTLGNQLYRALVSIPSNIAEGTDRETGNELQFLNVAKGSCQESIQQILIAKDVKLLKNEQAYTWIAILENCIDCIDARKGYVNTNRKRMRGSRWRNEEDREKYTNSGVDKQPEESQLPEDLPAPAHKTVDDEVNELDDDDPMKEDI